MWKFQIYFLLRQGEKLQGKEAEDRSYVQSERVVLIRPREVFAAKVPTAEAEAVKVTSGYDYFLRTN